MNYSTDKDLIAGCLAGRRDALETIVKRFSNSVYRAIQYVLKVKNIPYSKLDLEDLHNSVFLHLFENHCKKLGQYKGTNGCSLYSWIRIITVRTVIDHLRKKGIDALSHQKTNLPIEVLSDLRVEQPNPLDVIERADQIRLIQDGMKALLPRDRLFLKLHSIEGLSIGEVAEIMSISEENAHSIKHRAIKRLKSVILSRLESTTPPQGDG